jgi:hypothetical protein
MFHTHVLSVCSNFSSVLNVCCIQMFHVLEVCSESWGTAYASGIRHNEPGVGGRGVWHDWVLQTRRAYPHLIPGPGCAEREGAGSLEEAASAATRAGHGEADKGGLRMSL